MTELDQEWASIQAGINTCSVCLREELFKATENSPSRPISPEHTGRVLFLSEAPPSTGGFWRLDYPDDLREKFLALLGIQANSSKEALHSFMQRGYFLLQSLKWPLVKTFNHLGPRQQRRLIEHSARAHVGPEVETLRPKAILAMGKAAWLSCRVLSGQSNNDAGAPFEQDLGEIHLITVNGEQTKWMTTYLIIAQNLRLHERAEAIALHLENFLASHL